MRRPHAPVVAWCAAFVMAATLWLASAAFLKTQPPTYSVGDGAVLEIYTLHAARGALGVGPYSRFGWNHPGPIYFYALAPAYVLSGHREDALLLTALVGNLIILVCIAVAAARWGGWTFAAALMTWVTIFYLRPAPDSSWDFIALLTSSWNPHVPLLAFALLLILGAGLAAGHLAALPAAIVLASFVVQTHVGYLPVALCIVVTSVAAWCVQRFVYRRSDGTARSSGGTRLLLLVSGTVFVATWIAPIIAEMTGPQPGNLTRLMNRFGQDHHIDVSAGLAAFAYNLSGVLLPDFEAAAGGRVLDADAGSALATLFAAAQLIALPLAFFVMARRRRTFLAWLCAICLLASAVAAWACIRIGSDIVDHTVFWISMLGVVNLATLTAVSLELSAVPSVVARLRPQWIAPVLPVVLAGCGAAHLWQGHHQSRFADDRIAVRDLVRALDSRLGDGVGRNIAVRVDIAQGAWQIGAGVVLELYKRGEAVTVADAWVPLFGQPMAPDGSEAVEVILADDDRHAELQREARFERVASDRRAHLYVRRP